MISEPPPTKPDHLRPIPVHEPKFSIPPGPTTNVAAVTLVASAGAAAYGIVDPLLRAGVLAALAALVHLLGLFQPRPRG